MPDLRFSAPSGEVGGYLALPVQAGPHPGVVVIQDVFGLSDDIREQADRLAAAGYLAFAPDLYSGRGIRCVVATVRASRSGAGPAYADIEAARQLLAAREDCSGRIGIIGFCMGGGFALLCAPSGGYAVAAVNYGEVPDDAAARLADACPVVASYGARDRSMPGRAERLERALNAAGVAHDVKEYPDAGHSFMNRFNTGPLFTPLMHVAGMGYHHPSAEDAWRRIFAFFAERLR
ncbi:MAG TPA: dienelactone hydrolase family protein [Solirubrobacteraceae bacterium]|nr:dienelactone hydrolase family protein [Solirubrobacteraceae bacterium]